QEALPGALRSLFSPQHGFFGEKQDNMIESDHGVDPLLGLPVWSLYEKTRKPLPEMLASIDTLLVDLQDVGTRVYTFIYTLSYCMEAARDCDKEVVVLDRPNPLGGSQVEGNLLDPAMASFVGRYPMPMRHGMTIGELAGLFNLEFGIGCRLRVIPMTGWKRSMLFADTGLPWVAPSPNLPSPTSALVYPGQVLWEGTCVSEGRGTTQPFELFGAPFLDPERVRTRLMPPPRGVVLRTAAFQPTFHKFHGELCRGFQLHVVDPSTYRPYATTLRLVQAILREYPERWQWRPPPYEYEHHRLPFDLITGNEGIRTALEDGIDVEEMDRSWQADLSAWRRSARRFHLYE
ncbi:MAG: DUF1343 domain-containing protein, partial [Desulfobacteraceae bacterium]|nr:DUF1343 domain-containing protein [Desulfobacteraceae bacterium]